MATENGAPLAETAPNGGAPSSPPDDEDPTAPKQSTQTPQGSDDTPEKGASATTGVSIPESLVPPVAPDEKKPVYAQYIKDRVTGNSYIPREYRTGGEKHSDKFTYRDADGEDPADCTNRPPHWLCYVPPCVGRYPGVLEQNKCCQRLGQVGFHHLFKNRHIARRRLFFLGFAFNLAALVLTSWSGLAFSKTYGILTRSSFMRGHAKLDFTDGTSETLFTLNVGFRAVAFSDSDSELIDISGDEVVTFDTFCDAAVGELADELVNGVCGSCRDSSQAFIVSVVFNIAIIIKNMFSDVTRMYPRYDLNCPNLAGSLLSTLSVFLGLYTIMTYRDRCFNNIERSFNLANSTDIGDDGEVKFNWWPGPGLTCLSVATLLRFVDAICNYIVPTPTITRSESLRKEYEYEFGETMALREVKKGEAEQSFHEPARFVHASSKADEEEAAVGREGETTRTNRDEPEGTTNPETKDTCSIM